MFFVYRNPTNISNSETVWYLHMENGNNLGVLKTGSFIRSNLKSLEYLNLKSCRIRAVEPGAFAGSNFLIRIYLSGNLITVLNPDIFKDVPSLRVLRIDNNPINKFEDDKVFPNFTEFVRLDLSNCKLDTISANVFANLNSLRTLKLHGNKLKRLDWKVLQGKTNLTHLNLKNNPWHCDCHVKFLMETLKNMSLAKVFRDITCASADTPKWKECLWTQVPEEDMICQPEVNKLVFSSWSSLSQSKRYLGDDEKETLQSGQDLYLECEYSGFPKPEVEWFKDNQLIIGKAKDSKLLSTNLANARPKIELRNDTSSALQELEQEEESFRYKFREILVIHRIQMEDKGTYTCTVVHNHVATHKAVTLLEIKMPGYVEGNAIIAVWKWIVILIGLLLVVLTSAMTVISWTRRGDRKVTGIIQEPSINLAEFDIKPRNQDLILMPDDISDLTPV